MYISIGTYLHCGSFIHSPSSCFSLNLLNLLLFGPRSLRIGKPVSLGLGFAVLMILYQKHSVHSDLTSFCLLLTASSCLCLLVSCESVTVTVYAIWNIDSYKSTEIYLSHADTVKPLNDNLPLETSPLAFVERLASLWRSKMY